MAIAAKCCLSCGAGLPADGLVCEFCGAAHVFSAGAMAVACPGCGAGNAADARHCVQCRAALVVACPECRAASPHGSRYCQECRIEFRAYRRARVLRTPLEVREEAAAARVVEWLDGRWFKARDLRGRLRVIDAALLWVPTWRLRARVTGEVQGQASQTHHRTVSGRRFDGEAGRWVETVSSEPYLVWQHVTKRFDRTLDLRLPAAAAAAGCQDVLDLAGAPAGRPLDDVPAPAGPGERVFDPDLIDLQAFARLRGQAAAKLRAELLERVEALDARWLQPTLTLTYEPVWQVVYRYRRAHGEARVHGTTGVVAGRRITLLDQWFA